MSWRVSFFNRYAGNGLIVADRFGKQVEVQSRETQIALPRVRHVRGIWIGETGNFAREWPGASELFARPDDDRYWFRSEL